MRRGGPIRRSTARFDFRRRIEYAVWVRLLSLARVLFTLLAFQLAVGLQAAVASPAPVQVHDDSHAECPIHNTDAAQPAKSAHDTRSTHELAADPSALKHDCCKSSGCQCHCGSLPLAVTVTPVRIIPNTTLIRPALTTRAPSALPDTLFRPPIAS